MDLTMTICFIFLLFIPILYYLMCIYLGDKNDSAFSDTALKKQLNRIQFLGK